MSRIWNPEVRINLTGSGGKSAQLLAKGGGMSDLKIQFEFESHTAAAPASIQIVIYNLGEQKARQVRKEFTEITVEAGYEDNVGEIFRGTIVESMFGERVDNFTSELLRIYAVSNDLAYGNARLNEAMGAGWTHQDVIDRSAKALEKFGVPMGRVLGVDASAIRHPRPAMLVGMVRDIMRETCLSLGATWTMNNGRLDVIGIKHPGTGSSNVVLGPESGLYGQVIQRLDGVVLTCAINPLIKLNSTVRIKSKILSPNLSPNLLLRSQTFNISEYADQLNESGDYRVIHIRASADTRGDGMTMTLTTIGVGKNLNQTQLGLNYL